LGLYEARVGVGVHIWGHRSSYFPWSHFSSTLSTNHGLVGVFFRVG
jgi:hypothetical protein